MHAVQSLRGAACQVVVCLGTPLSCACIVMWCVAPVVAARGHTVCGVGAG
jgi:hypothetical protein